MVRNVSKTDLKVLAEAVMSMMPMEGKFVVEVDKMARVLETKKDKVFAICNVREGLRLMERQSMNMYMWQGRTVLMSTLMMLKQMGEKEDMMGQLSLVRNFINLNIIGELQRVIQAKESQKLMMMFLTLPQSMSLLLEASIIIDGPVLMNAKRKYSMQRLEDIAKIIASVGLVAKVMKKKKTARSTSHIMWGRRFLNCCLS